MPGPSTKAVGSLLIYSLAALTPYSESPSRSPTNCAERGNPVPESSASIGLGTGTGHLFQLVSEILKKHAHCSRPQRRSCLDEIDTTSIPMIVRQYPLKAPGIDFIVDQRSRKQRDAQPRKGAVLLLIPGTLSHSACQISRPCTLRLAGYTPTRSSRLQG